MQAGRAGAGAGKKSRGYGLAIGLTLGGFALMIVIGLVAARSAGGVASSLGSSSTSSDPKCPTYTKFTALQTGMSRGGVNTIMGSDGSESGSGSSKTVVYKCASESGASVTVGFTNNVLSTKKQSGL